MGFSATSLAFLILESTSYAIVVFCCYALATVGKGLLYFPDRPESAAQLLQDIERCKRELAARGFNADIDQLNGAKSVEGHR